MLERFTQEQPPATPLAPPAGSTDVNMDLSGALHAVLPNSRTVVLQGQAHAGFRTHPSWWQLRSSSSYGYNVGDALGRGVQRDGPMPTYSGCHPPAAIPSADDSRPRRGARVGEARGALLAVAVAGRTALSASSCVGQC